MARNKTTIEVDLKGRRESVTGLQQVDRAIDSVGDEAGQSSGQVRRLGTSLHRTDRQARRSRGAFRALRRGARGLAMGVGGAAAGLVAMGAYAIPGLITEAEKLATVEAVTANAIRKTGGAANVTAQEVQALTSELQAQTGTDDKLITEGANILLTFKGIRNEVGKGNDVFSRANQMMMDLSQVTGTDMKSAATQLGKALDDPIKGLTALRRSGVSFTEQQQEQIRGMVESGDLLGAQTMILDEMSTQYGGAAAAGADATDKIKAGFGDVKEELGTGLLPLVARVAETLPDFLQRNRKNVAAFINGVVRGVTWLASAISGLTTMYKENEGLAKTLGITLGVLAAALAVVAAPVTLVVVGLTALVLWFGKSYKESDKFRNRVDTAFLVVKKAGLAMVGVIIKGLGFLLSYWSKAASTLLGGAARVAEALGMKGVAERLRGAQRSVDRFADDATAALKRLEERRKLEVDTTQAEAAIQRVRNKLSALPGIDNATADSLARRDRAAAARGAARGGRTITAGLTLVGERGPELAHLPEGAKIEPLPAGQQLMGSSFHEGGGRPHEHPIYIEGREVFRAVDRESSRRQDRS